MRWCVLLFLLGWLPASAQLEYPWGEKPEEVQGRLTWYSKDSLQLLVHLPDRFLGYEAGLEAYLQATIIAYEVKDGAYLRIDTLAYSPAELAIDESPAFNALAFLLPVQEELRYLWHVQLSAPEMGYAAEVVFRYKSIDGSAMRQLDVLEPDYLFSWPSARLAAEELLFRTTSEFYLFVYSLAAVPSEERSEVTGSPLPGAPATDSWQRRISGDYLLSLPKLQAALKGKPGIMLAHPVNEPPSLGQIFFVPATDSSSDKAESLDSIPDAALKYLMTEEEWRNWQRLAGKEYVRFKEDFWISIIQQTLAPVKRRFLEQLNVATEYGSDYLTGWQTEAGCLITLLGLPDEVEHYGEICYWRWTKSPVLGRSLRIRWRQAHYLQPGTFVLAQPEEVSSVLQEAAANWRHGLLPPAPY